MNHVTHPLGSADINNFSPEIGKFCYIKIVLIKMATIMMMSAKMATQALLKIKVFQSKGYSILIHVHDVTNKLLSHDSNYIVDVVSDQSLVTVAFLREKLPP